jgi:hypothetical protein
MWSWAFGLSSRITRRWAQQMLGGLHGVGIWADDLDSVQKEASGRELQVLHNV